MKSIFIEDLKIYIDLEDITEDYVDIFDIDVPFEKLQFMDKRIPTVEELLAIQPIDIKGLTFFADFYLCTVKDQYLTLLNMDTGILSTSLVDVPYRVRLVQDV